MFRSTAQPRTVGLVGLGVIGRVHLDVLAAEPRVTLSFLADPRAFSTGQFSTPHRCAFYDDLARALRAVRGGDIPEPDLIVLATPTSTHLALTSEVLSQTSADVLCEKPLTGNPMELEAFERRHLDAPERLSVVNHFAFSPEVEWAAHFVEQHSWGTPAIVLSNFNDPYVKKSAADQATYVSSWIDSGPNQLGLLARFVSGYVIRSHTALRNGMRAITEVNYDGGSAILSSNWHTGDSSKQTSLRWPDGRELVLDHTSMTGFALDAAKPLAHFGHTGVTDRKTAHYAAMYKSYLTGPSSHLLSLTFARSMAALLHYATTSAPRVESLDWFTAQH